MTPLDKQNEVKQQRRFLFFIPDSESPSLCSLVKLGHIGTNYIYQPLSPTPAVGCFHGSDPVYDTEPGLCVSTRS